LISKLCLKVANYQLKVTEIEMSNDLLTVIQKVSGSSGNTKSYDFNLALSALDHNCLIYVAVFSEGLVFGVVFVLFFFILIRCL